MWVWEWFGAKLRCTLTGRPAVMRLVSKPPDFTSSHLYWMWYRSNMVLTTFVPAVEHVERRPLPSISVAEFVRFATLECAATLGSLPDRCDRVGADVAAGDTIVRGAQLCSLAASARGQRPRSETQSAVGHDSRTDRPLICPVRQPKLQRCDTVHLVTLCTVGCGACAVDVGEPGGAVWGRGVDSGTLFPRRTSTARTRRRQEAQRRV